MNGKAIFALCLMLCCLLSAPSCLWAQKVPFLRDFIILDVPDTGRLEISGDYLLMNDTIDLFDFRERELGSSAIETSPALGDLKGGRLMVNYGPIEKTGLHFAYARTDLEAGPVEFSIDSIELYLRRQLWAQDHQRQVGGSLDFGGRFNRAQDRTISRVSDIDSLIKRINSRFSVEENSSDVTFSNGEFFIRTPKEGRPPLAVSLEDMQDYTVYVRLIAGRFFDGGGIHLFAELGHSEIDSTIDSNLEAYLPEAFRDQLQAFPLSLDRNENYWKIGSDLHLQLPLGLMGNLRYEYLRLDRDAELDFVDYNHVVKGELVFPVTERVALNLGATYLRRQFNGVIPLMYNRLTQTTFDHDYGFINMGLTVRLP